MVRGSLVYSSLQVLEVSRRDDGLTQNYPFTGWPSDKSDLISVAFRIHLEPNALTATSVPD
jgi:hypothetical protein